MYNFDFSKLDKMKKKQLFFYFIFIRMHNTYQKM